MKLLKFISYSLMCVLPIFYLNLLLQQPQLLFPLFITDDNNLVNLFILSFIDSILSSIFAILVSVSLSSLLLQLSVSSHTLKILQLILLLRQHINLKIAAVINAIIAYIIAFSKNSGVNTVYAKIKNIANISIATNNGLFNSLCNTIDINITHSIKDILIY